MTRKEAVRIERRLRARGVYRPYVTERDGTLCIESYPLAVYVTPGEFDPESGPTTDLRLVDYTLVKIGDSTVTIMCIHVGQDIEQHASRLLIDHHADAYARAQIEDRGQIS
jgi:hypothetical protein